MDHLKRLVRKNLYQLMIVVVVALIGIANYVPGAHLLGWDAIATELNPALGVSRAWASVWQEHQSFGLLAGLAHGADLIRAVFIWLLSLVLPQHMIRFSFHILMLLVGSIGAYGLIRYLLRKPNNQSPSNKSISNSAAFVGALFYALNLSTIQIFYVPLEAFSVFFAALPFLIHHFLKVVDRPAPSKVSKNQLITFALVNLLATPAFMIQTLFIVYAMVLGALTAGLAVARKSGRVLVRGVSLGVLIVALNSFWLLPQSYFFATSADVLPNAKITQLSVDTKILQNREKGSLGHLLKLEGFYWELFDGENKPLFGFWKEHFNIPVVNVLPFLFGLLILLGIAHKSPYRLSLALTYGVCAFWLLGDTPGFGYIHDLIYQHPTIRQTARAPFTKFAIPLALFSSIFVAHAVLTVGEKMKKIPITSYVMAGLILVYAAPVFGGYYFSPNMRVKLPQAYTQLFEYMNSRVDENARVGLLPEATFWGWYFTRWDYNGSGFLWYGIRQPVVSRNFDIWSQASESYYWELSDAVVKEDVAALEQVFEKYNVSYLVFDTSLLPVSSTLEGLQYERVEALLDKSNKVVKDKNFGHITTYTVQTTPHEAYVATTTALPNTGPVAYVSNHDFAYADIGTYQTDEKAVFQRYYPFADFFSQTEIAEPTWDIQERADDFIIQTRLPQELSGAQVIPALFTQDLSFVQDGAVTATRSAAFISKKEATLAARVPKNLVAAADLNTLNIVNCRNLDNTQGISTQHQSDAILIQMKDSESACVGWDAPQLEQRHGYLAKVVQESRQGPPAYFNITDKTKETGYIERQLHDEVEYFLLSDNYRFGRGYTFVYRLESYTNTPAQATLKSIEVYALPYEQIRSAYLAIEQVQKARFTTLPDVEKIGFYRYEVEDIAPEAEHVVLYQAYHAGWKGYLVKPGSSNIERRLKTTFPFLFDKPLKHVMVNNWANGWALPSSTQLNTTNNDQTNQLTLVLIFWPQYLQYVGFAIALVTLASIAVVVKKPSKYQ